MEAFDVLIIGGGAAGISAAKALWEKGVRSLALIERKPSLGGILLQCVHPGFGDRLDGRAYARELAASFPQALPRFSGVTATEIGPAHSVRLSDGRALSCRVLILATGAREIPIGALPITGTRPKGVFTAGQMQEMMNCFGYEPNGPAVILGSGDIGLVMAWQLGRLGLSVTVVEQKERISGRMKNRERLKGLPVRFLLDATIEEIEGFPAITAVTLSNGERIPCGVLLCAAGLLPERELLRDMPVPEWVIPAGNANRIHPVIESVLEEGEMAAERALKLLSGHDGRTETEVF